MSALPNPLTNIANASLLQSPAERRSRYRQTDDPQLGSLLDQRTQERCVLDFQLHVLEKRASRGIQEFVSVQPMPRGMETQHAQGRREESPEMTWLVENRRALEMYRGEWLLISNDMLIVHNADFGEIRKAVTQRGIRSPFVYYVPTEVESNFIDF